MEELSLKFLTEKNNQQEVSQAQEMKQSDFHLKLHLQESKILNMFR